MSKKLLIAGNWKLNGKKKIFHYKEFIEIKFKKIK